MSGFNLPPGVSLSDQNINPTDGVEIQVNISDMYGTLLEAFLVLGQDDDNVDVLARRLRDHIEHHFEVTED